VLLTGMSGTGKSTLVRELRQRGYAAHDAGEGFAESRADGRWGWRADLLAHADGLLFFAGCSEEQADLPFDFRVLLTPRDPSWSGCAPAPTTCTGALTTSSRSCSPTEVAAGTGSGTRPGTRWRRREGVRSPLSGGARVRLCRRLARLRGLAQPRDGLSQQPRDLHL
jgi:hypothetical protein